jgi:hypothetical protein
VWPASGSKPHCYGLRGKNQPTAVAAAAELHQQLTYSFFVTTGSVARELPTGIGVQLRGKIRPVVLFPLQMPFADSANYFAFHACQAPHLIPKRMTLWATAGL